MPRQAADVGGITRISRLAIGFSVASAVLIVTYPMVVYYVLQHYSARSAAWVMLAGLVPMTLRQVVGRQQQLSWSTLIWPLLAGAAILAAALANSTRTLLLVPVCINGALLLSFGSTLLSDRPLIERFARLQHADLTVPEQRWCRLWTIVWTGFFAVNILVASVLAVFEQVAWWTFYNGLVTYVVMGGLFSTEYVVRKYRFRRFTAHGPDRLLLWCFAKLERAHHE